MIRRSSCVVRRVAARFGRGPCIILLLTSCWGGPVLASEPALGNDGGENSAQGAETIEPDPESNQSLAGRASPRRKGEQTVDEVNKEEAKERYSRGLRFHQEGDLSLALIEFERAYQLVPDYRVLYNVGQVSILLGRFAGARIALSRYLDDGGDRLSEERREAVSADLEMLKARTAELSIQCNLAGARVLINDVLRGETPLSEPLVLDAGKHRVEVQKPGFESKSEYLTLAGAETVELTFSLTKATQKEPIIIVRREPRAPLHPDAGSEVAQKHKTSPWLVAGWITTGSFAGGAALTALLGLSSSNKSRKIEESPDPDVSAYSRHQRAAKARYLAADLLTIGAVVTGATTLYFTLRKHRNPNKADTSQLHVGMSASCISLTGSFQ